MRMSAESRNMTQQSELLLEQNVDVDLVQRLFLKSVEASTPEHCIDEILPSRETIIARHIVKLLRK